MLIVQLNYTPKQAGEMTLSEVGWEIERILYKNAKATNQATEPIPDDYDKEAHINRALAVYNKFQQKRGIA